MIRNPPRVRHTDHLFPDTTPFRSGAAGNRKALAEMIVAAANHAERDRASTRQLASDGILRDPVLSVWRSGSGEQADHIFATMNGTADDDRTYPFLMASEARYRKLMHFKIGRAHV